MNLLALRARTNSDRILAVATRLSAIHDFDPAGRMLCASRVLRDASKMIDSHKPAAWITDKLKDAIDLIDEAASGTQSAACKQACLDQRQQVELLIDRALDECKVEA